MPKLKDNGTEIHDFDTQGMVMGEYAYPVSVDMGGHVLVDASYVPRFWQEIWSLWGPVLILGACGMIGYILGVLSCSGTFALVLTTLIGVGIFWVFFDKDFQRTLFGKKLYIELRSQGLIILHGREKLPLRWDLISGSAAPATSSSTMARKPSTCEDRTLSIPTISSGGCNGC